MLSKNKAVSNLKIFSDFIKLITINYLPLSSTIVTVTWLGSPRVTLLGSEDELLMVSLKFSLPSTISSSLIVTLNVIRVCSAGNVTVYGPEK